MFKELMGVLGENLRIIEFVLAMSILIIGALKSFFTFITASEFEVQLFSKENRVLHKVVNFVLVVLISSGVSLIVSALYKPIYKETILGVCGVVFMLLITFFISKFYIGRFFLEMGEAFLPDLTGVKLKGKITTIKLWIQKKRPKLFKVQRHFDIIVMLTLYITMIYILLYVSYMEQINLAHQNLSGYVLAYRSVLMLTFLLFGSFAMVLFGYMNAKKTETRFYIKNEAGNKHYLLYPLNKNEILFSGDIGDSQEYKRIIYNRKDLSKAEFYKTEVPRGSCTEKSAYEKV